MNSTLLLNANGLPLSVLPISSYSWQEAIKLVYSDKCNIIEEYEDWYVHSPSMEIKVPAVIMLNDYHFFNHEVDYSRNHVLLRDEYTCQYCGLEAHDDQRILTMDHVVPRYHGGKTGFHNIVTACQSCNMEKAHYTKMKPKNLPRKPTYYQLVFKRIKYPVNIPSEKWVPYLPWEDKSLIKVKNSIN